MFNLPLIVKSLPITTLPSMDESPNVFKVVILAVGIVAIPVKVGDSIEAFKFKEESTYVILVFRFNDESV
jgi:hypothetical protein